MPEVKLPKKNKPRPESLGRPIVYPDVSVILARGEDALTVEQLKGYLGWTEETEDVKFGPDYVLIDEEGKKIRCVNNGRNRPVDMTWVYTLAQDVLNRHWKFNGESVIIGKTGQVLSAQHRMFAHILAEQMRTGKQSGHWEDKGWKLPVTMETVVVVGIDEGSETTRTLDNVRKRTLSDVLFCDPTMFAKIGNKAASNQDRIKLTRITETAVTMLWHRMGVEKDAFRKRKTHSETLSFIERHPHLLRAVVHIFEEKGDSEVSLLGGAGYAAGMLYLMGSGSTDGDRYRNLASPSEKRVEFDLWDKACEFWRFALKEMDPNLPDIAKANGKFIGLRQGLAALADSMTGAAKASRVEIMGTVALAWDMFLKGKKLDAAKLKLEYGPRDDQGRCKVVNHPIFGNLDIGEPAPDVDKDKGADKDDDNDEDSIDDLIENPGEDKGEGFDDPANDEDMETRKEATRRETQRLERVAETQRKKDAAARRKAALHNPPTEDAPVSEDDTVITDDPANDVPEEFALTDSPASDDEPAPETAPEPIKPKKILRKP